MGTSPQQVKTGSSNFDDIFLNFLKYGNFSSNKLLNAEKPTFNEISTELEVSIKEEPEEVVILSCIECNQDFLDQESLNKHIKKHEREISNAAKYENLPEVGDYVLRSKIKAKPVVMQKKKPVPKKKEIPLTCNQCKKVFKSLKNLTEHRIVHRKNKNHTCKECPMTFKRKKDKLRHQRKCLERQEQKKQKEIERMNRPKVLEQCDECFQSFSSKQSVRHHKIIKHTTEFNFKCRKCDYKTKTKPQLKSHMVTHSDKKPYSCDICENKSFKSKTSLKYHNNTKHPQKEVDHMETTLSNIIMDKPLPDCF